MLAQIYPTTSQRSLALSASSRKRVRHGHDRKTNAMSRQLRKTKTRMQSAREKASALLRVLAVLTILAIFGLLAYGSVKIVESERCRYPKNILVEEFRYKIDNLVPEPRLETVNGKPSYAVGAKLSKIKLDQGFGSYTILANRNPAMTDVVIIVENRAIDSFHLKYMSEMYVNATVGTNPITNITEPRVILEIKSVTSNTNFGQVRCRRADITLIVPTACLLEDTKLDISLEIGTIYVKDLTYVNPSSGHTERVRFDTVTLRGEKGTIKAEVSCLWSQQTF